MPEMNARKSNFLRTVGAFWRDLRYAFRSLSGSKGLTVTVVLTLALGIGANAAIFTLVRGVLLRPLVNRDEDKLIYIRQSARGEGVENVNFSVPEMDDLRQRVKYLSAIGDFSVISFTMNGLGEPREVRAGVVGGNYFEVMGLRPVLGRLLDARDDGPKAAGAVVLTYRFWTTAFKGDPSVIGKAVRLESFGPRTATVVGVLEPSVPYPAETEIIANVVTSPHHLSATMVTGRIHRMTELFGRLAPGATLEQALTASPTTIKPIASSLIRTSASRSNAPERPASNDANPSARLGSLGRAGSGWFPAGASPPPAAVRRGGADAARPARAPRDGHLATCDRERHRPRESY